MRSEQNTRTDTPFLITTNFTFLPLLVSLSVSRPSAQRLVRYCELHFMSSDPPTPSPALPALFVHPLPLYITTRNSSDRIHLD